MRSAQTLDGAGHLARSKEYRVTDPWTTPILLILGRAAACEHPDGRTLL